MHVPTVLTDSRLREKHVRLGIKEDKSIMEGNVGGGLGATCAITTSSCQAVKAIREKMKRRKGVKKEEA